MSSPAFKVSDAKRERIYARIEVDVPRFLATPVGNEILAIIEEPDEPEFTWADVQIGDVVEYLGPSGRVCKFIVIASGSCKFTRDPLLRVDRKDASGRYVTVFEKTT